ncbi:hypothetical protein X926_08465 [Petrotoga sp. HWHPT.55.6.3]|nr:hypothetical protein X926_08465 [Petrotoga sp. HWHPT.55.6.3]
MEILIVKTDEELMIAQDTKRKVKKFQNVVKKIRV